MEEEFTPLNELALIGDRRTCALLDKGGNIVWYCPKRFDHSSLFAHLLDPEKGGSWSFSFTGMAFEKRSYLEDSALLQTFFTSGKESLMLEDWMPLDARFYGICRKLTAAPQAYSMQIDPRPNYGRQSAVVALIDERRATIQFDFHLYASHALEVQGESITCQVPAGEEAWFILAENALKDAGEILEEVRKLSLKNWEKIASHITYKGHYEAEVRNSLRLLRMLTFAQNGGIIAAATTSLPEVVGGERNYDYRYVWLRDAAMIVSALTRAGSDGEEERKFLSFICSAMHRIPAPVVPMFTLDMQPAGRIQPLPFKGYKESKPVRYGNGAGSQLQLDANSNVLIAAKVIYNSFNTKEHWSTVQRLANFLVDYWQEPDHGIWEETEKHQYTSSKVIASVSLQYIAEHSEDAQEKKLWLDTAALIKQYVEENCLTTGGAYAVYAGAEAVDVSTILFPIWGYTAADADAMLKTVEELENELCENNLYRRYLVESDSKKEGAFLAGTLWVAQYWVMRKEWEKVEAILNAALRFMNDLGLMPEEGNPKTGEWLGNLPQTFVHASLIGLIIDYERARWGDKQEG